MNKPPDPISPSSSGHLDVSVVVPVYNSESSLVPLTGRLLDVLSRCANRYELILVNDGSGDSSWQVITELAARYQWVRGISLLRNSGQHNALLCGIRDARYGCIVTIDDDLQHPPEQIPLLLDELRRGVDVVYGVPHQQKHGLMRDLASTITKLALRGSTGAEVARNASAFRVFRTHLRRAFATYSSPFVSVDVLLTWSTTRYAAVAVEHHPRQIGISNYTIRKLVTHTLNMMTGFSTAPLRLATLAGFAFTLFGMLVLLYVVSTFLIYGREVPGFAFLASVVVIFSGVQLFALGIMGEYLARIHVRTMSRPSYSIRSRTRRLAKREHEVSRVGNNPD